MPLILCVISAFIHRADYNFIAVDWQKPAAGPWYLSASNNIVPVGKALAKLVDRLIAIKAIRLDTLHLIGFSLGAHVSSIAANHMTSGRVPRITGIFLRFFNLFFTLAAQTLTTAVKI